jgi:hypothetical protein
VPLVFFDRRCFTFTPLPTHPRALIRVDLDRRSSTCLSDCGPPGLLLQLPSMPTFIDLTDLVVPSNLFDQPGHSTENSFRHSTVNVHEHTINCIVFAFGYRSRLQTISRSFIISLGHRMSSHRSSGVHLLCHTLQHGRLFRPPLSSSLLRSHLLSCSHRISRCVPCFCRPS